VVLRPHSTQILNPAFAASAQLDTRQFKPIDFLRISFFLCLQVIWSINLLIIIKSSDFRAAIFMLILFHFWLFVFSPFFCLNFEKRARVTFFQISQNGQHFRLRVLVRSLNFYPQEWFMAMAAPQNGHVAFVPHNCCW
jgi:hypothetical protein